VAGGRRPAGGVPPLADDVPFSVFDLSDRLRLRGWVVPAYRMAADAESVAVLRIVVREGLSRDMADCLLADIVAAIDHLRASPRAHAADPVNPPAANAHRGGPRPPGCPGSRREARDQGLREGRLEDEGRMLKIGVLGAANIAPGALIKPAQRTGRAEVVAVAARDVDKARAYAKKHKIPRVADSYEALLADPELDAVYIPLPNGLHGHWTIAALQAGKHVLCEKPFTANADEARQWPRPRPPTPAWSSWRPSTTSTTR
jgi:hypothetical protein